jgi:hypothetical protein
MNAKYSAYPTISLDSKVIAFDAGIRWHVIPLDIMQKHPIIYDKLMDKTNKEVDVSITRCPYTSTIVIYEGKMKLGDTENNNIILKKNGSNIQQLTGECSKKNGNCFVRRWEAYVMTLSNVLHELTDCEYLINETDGDTICEIDTSDEMVGLSYESSDINIGQKYFAIVSDDFIKIKEYISQFHEKMTKKNGFLIPTRIDTWMSFHPDSKKIKL